jgi:hypothetical protein
MKLDVLQRDWNKAHLGGNVFILGSNGTLLLEGKQTGRFAVTFTSDGKTYTYHYKSVYALAERLGMIPTERPDNMDDARKAVDAILSGNSYSSICGLSDSMSYILRNTGIDCYGIEYTSDTKDEYDRTVYTYTGYKSVKPW